MTGAHHPDAIPTQQTGIARYMEHRRSGPAQTLEKAPWVVVVEGGQDAQARLFEPLELEGEGRSSLHPPSDAFRQVGGDAEAGDLRRAQPEQPFGLRNRLDDGPELPGFQRFGFAIHEPLREQQAGERAIAPAPGHVLRARASVNG